LKNKLKDGDVVNIHEGDGISTIFALLRFRIKKDIKVIVTNHALVLMRRNSFISNLPNRYLLLKIIFIFFMPYYYLVERNYLKNADCIVTITQKTKKFIQKYYIKKFDNVIIRNGLDNSKRILRKYDEPKTAIIVGAATYPKGLDIAIESIVKFNSAKDKESDKINLRIIGFWDFEKYFKDKKESKYIQHIGQVEHKDMNEQYSQADFMLFPSRSEEFASLVVLEALQNGLPVVVSNECNINEMDNWNDWAYQINTWDVDDWVTGIEKITNTDNFKQKQQAVNEQDFSKYDWKYIAKQYDELFNKI
jgi:glycosyltransferase involved in cell wall biosynthesis